MPQVVTFDDWLKIDKAEVERGQAQGKPREKASGEQVEAPYLTQLPHATCTQPNHTQSSHPTCTHSPAVASPHPPHTTTPFAPKPPRAKHGSVICVGVCPGCKLLCGPALLLIDRALQHCSAPEEYVNSRLKLCRQRLSTMRMPLYACMQVVSVDDMLEIARS